MNPDPIPTDALDSPEELTRTNRPRTDASGHGSGDRPLPASIGRYRILRLLGEGGMGVVYEAEQDYPRRKVALKVLKGGLTDSDLLWRFELESQALGRLRHPGIAQIYEAGTADTGFGIQPYFAMELIHGASLLEDAEAHHLTTRQRLEIMVKICEAVHHAHQCGVIHRDLKPGNILVEESGQPKILDLGVARLTNSDAQATRQTNVGQLVGTLAYMSPEQVLADPLELDTRSDVYALGVILFELLAGRLPYKINQHLPEAVHAIREEDPAPLSSISRMYRGDIETIVGKALEKDKARRYSSAADLGADIQRYLKDEPITARPPSTTYQLQKFARRNKALVAGVLAVFVVLISGIIASTWEATRARRAEARAIQERNRAVTQEKRADTEAATANAINDFLQNDLLAQASATGQARPDTKLEPDLKVRTALDRAASRIGRSLAKEPVVEASVRETIGETYKGLGLYAQAQQQLEYALQLRERALGDSHRDTLVTMNDLAELYQALGKYRETEPLLDKILEQQRRALGEEHPDTLHTLNGLAALYWRQGKYPQAEALYLKLIDIERRVLGPEHSATVSTMNDLAILYSDQGKYTQEEPLLTKCLEVERRQLGDEHPDTLTGMQNLAVTYVCLGKYSQAELLLTNAVRTRRRVLGEEHPGTLFGLYHLGSMYMYEGKYAQAEPLLNKAFQARRRLLTENHPDTMITMSRLAELKECEYNYADAQTLYARALKLQQRVLGPEHPYTARTMILFGGLYLKMQRYSDAEEILRKGLNAFMRTTPDSWRRYDAEALLGSSLVGQRRYGEAERLLITGYQGMLQRQDTIPAFNRFKLEQAGRWINQLYERWSKPDKAGEQRAKP